MASSHPRQIDLEEVKQKLNQAEADLRAGVLAPDAYTVLTTGLYAKEARLENQIYGATPTPAPAPPGNSITLPQVLPLASFLSSPSLEFASSTITIKL